MEHITSDIKLSVFIASDPVASFFAGSITGKIAIALMPS